MSFNRRSRLITHGVARSPNRAMLRAVRTFVEANSEDVGRKFASQARKMHDGEIEHRAIRGEASNEEVKALLDDGIEVHPLPVLPDDRN